MSEENNATFLSVKGIRFRLKASPNLGANPSKPVVVLFHRYSFSLDEWQKIGTLEVLSNHSIPYLALDLPRGKTSKSQKREFPELRTYVPILEELFREAGVTVQEKLIMVGPSMGGAFALTYALERKQDVLGLVLVAPSLSGIDRDSLEELDVPTLLIWGDRDTVFPVEQYGRELKETLPQSKLLIMKGSRHPVYLDKPEEFHELLLDFIEEISS